MLNLPEPVRQQKIAGYFVSTIDLKRSYTEYEVGVFTDNSAFEELHMKRFGTLQEALAEHDRVVGIITREAGYRPRSVTLSLTFS